MTACQSVGDGKVGAKEGWTDGLTFKHQPTTCEERGTGRVNGDKVCGIAGRKDAILKNPYCWMEGAGSERTVEEHSVDGQPSLVFFSLVRLPT